MEWPHIVARADTLLRDMHQPCKDADNRSNATGETRRVARQSGMREGNKINT